MLLFDKQYRAERKIIKELARKIDKSESFSVDAVGDAEIYKLNSIQISFNIKTNMLIVSSLGTGEILFSMDCHFDTYKEMQQQRSSWFSILLLEHARKRSDDELKKQEKEKLKLEKLRKVKTTMEQANKNKTDQAMLRDALKRIRQM